MSPREAGTNTKHVSLQRLEVTKPVCLKQEDESRGSQAGPRSPIARLHREEGHAVLPAMHELESGDRCCSGALPALELKRSLLRIAAEANTRAKANSSFRGRENQRND